MERSKKEEGCACLTALAGFSLNKVRDQETKNKQEEGRLSLPDCLGRLQSQESMRSRNKGKARRRKVEWIRKEEEEQEEKGEETKNKQEEGRLCLPDCLGGLQSEEGACLLAGDIALGLPLPHHQGLQLQVVHRQQPGLGTQLTLLNTLTDCIELYVESGLSTKVRFIRALSSR